MMHPWGGGCHIINPTAPMQSGWLLGNCKPLCSQDVGPFSTACPHMLLTQLKPNKDTV